MSGWGPAHLPGNAIEQRHSKFILKGFDLLRHGRLRQQQFLRSATKVQVSGNRTKDFEPEVLHRSLLSTGSAKRCNLGFLPQQSLSALHGHDRRRLQSNQRASRWWIARQLWEVLLFGFAARFVILVLKRTYDQEDPGAIPFLCD